MTFCAIDLAGLIVFLIVTAGCTAYCVRLYTKVLEAADKKVKGSMEETTIGVKQGGAL
ncbi:MAG: hypothetical protein Q4C53_08020 [Clostridia bacterium]|nr:hypothetical protein [Clostridia bacterium]